MQSHEHYMQRALELAARGTGCTSPNPLVGSVVVLDGAIVGEGWHELYGQNHAEVNALNAANSTAIKDFPNNRNATQGATLYVTLEPCHHHGLTPPCTQAIVEAGIVRVVYALADPNPCAAGGARWLASQGIDVISGVLQAEARYQNRIFLNYQKYKLPYVIAKSATSLDGRVATRTGHSQWITGPEARQQSHLLRQAVDAIIVGVDTVISDNPSLTVRLPQTLCSNKNIRHPRPVILDSRGRTPVDCQLVNGAQPTRPLIALTDKTSTDIRHQLESNNTVDIIELPENPNGPGVDPEALLQALAQLGIQSVLLEGGPTVHGTFRDADLIDEVWTFVAPMIIGGSDAPPSYAAIGSANLPNATRLQNMHIDSVGQDIVIRGLVARARNEEADSCSTPAFATGLPNLHSCDGESPGAGSTSHTHPIKI